MLEVCFDECNDFSDARKSKINPKYNLTNLTLDEYDYSEWFKKEDKESAYVPLIPPLDGDEDECYSVSSTLMSKDDKVGKRSTISIPSKLLTRLSILLA